MLAVLIDLEIQLGNELTAVANGRSGLRSPLTFAETGPDMMTRTIQESRIFSN
jgi:hypothetical protein